jgi:hypothetical protein
MALDNPLTLLLVFLMLLLLVGAGLASSLSILFAFVPSARDWLKEQIARLLRQR